MTNGSSDVLGVIRIGPDDVQAPLLSLQPGASAEVQASSGDRLGFSRSGDWFGAAYQVTSAPEQAVTAPVQAQAGVAGGPVLRITNTTKAELAVIAIAPDSGQTGLARVAGRSVGEVAAATGQTLAFAQGDRWIGDYYVVAGTSGEAVSIPIALVPQAPQEVIRQSGPGSVVLRLMNRGGGAVDVLVVDASGSSSYVIATVAPGASTEARALPDTTLHIVRSGTTDPVGGAYRVTTGASQDLRIPVLTPLQERNAGPGSAPVRFTNAASFPIDIAMIDVSGSTGIVATAPPGQPVSVPLVAPATLYFYNAATRQPVGDGYSLAAGEGQLALPVAPSFPASVRDPRGVSVTLSNPTGRAILVARIMPGGQATESLGVLRPGGVLQGPLARETELAFYDEATQAALGDAYRVTADANQRVQLPLQAAVAAADPAVLKQSGPGSRALKLTNTSRAALFVAVEEGGQSYRLAELPASSSRTIQALPKSRLWFYDASTQQVAGGLYEPGGRAGEEARVPIDAAVAGDPGRAGFIGPNAVTVDIRNGSGTPAYVVARNTTGLVSLLYEIPGGQALPAAINPGTLVWFVKKGSGPYNPQQQGEPLGRKLPYLVQPAGTAQGVALPYEPSDRDVERLAQVDLNKLADEIVAGLRKDGEAAKAQAKQPIACWKNTQTRGVGTIPTTCKPGEQDRDGLCYDTCRPGYRDAVTMCVPDCPAGFKDDGLFCRKPAAIQRSSYPLKFGEFSLDGARARCRSSHGENCTQIGAIIYSTCPSNYKTAPIAVNLCSPTCPAGMPDGGISCRKTTYDRGVGRLKQCPPGKVGDAGLCYNACGPDSAGVGPVCWNQCPKNMAVNCGTTCAASINACIMAVSDQVNTPLMAGANILLTVVTAGAGTAATMSAKTALTAAKAAGTAITKQTIKQVGKEAAEQAAKQSFKTNIRTILAAGGRQGATIAGKKLAKDTAVDLVLSTTIAGVITGLTQVPWHGVDAARNDIKVEVQRRVRERMAARVSDAQLETIVNAAFEAAKQAKPNVEFPYTALDPTGVADIVVAYNLPMCNDVK